MASGVGLRDIHNACDNLKKFVNFIDASLEAPLVGSEVLAMVKDQPYFAGNPEAFKTTADILLVLDSKKELPAHSTMLSAHSEVLCDMLMVLKAADTATAVRRFPFPDCSDAEASAFLAYLYAENRSKVLSTQSAELLSSIAHKYGLADTLRHCDDFLASKVHPDGQSAELWPEGTDAAQAVHLLVVAEAHCLPRLAELAEEFILRNGGNLSAIQESNLMSRMTLLRLLDRRHKAVTANSRYFCWDNT